MNLFKIFKSTFFFAAFASLLFVFGCSQALESEGAGAANGKNGNIEVKGSDTLLQMVSNLAEAYSAKNPGTHISVTGGGSGTGISALINGEIHLADSSRRIKREE